MTYQKGFTLIEIIVVLAILTFIVSFGLIIDLNFFKSNILRAEQSVIVSTLEKARSRSVSNMFESAHGFCYVAPNYIVFRDRTTCLPVGAADEVIPANTTIASNPLTTFSPGTIIFSQIAGTTTDATIHITDGLKSADITINNEGTIVW